MGEIRGKSLKRCGVNWSMVQRVLVTVGVLIALFGLVWLLQGGGVLPGSAMSGSQFWEMAGALTFIVRTAVAGIGLKK
jgi:hypothetical protein